MAHTYTPTNWVDEVPASTPVKYQIIDDITGEICASATIAPVTSITPGTPLNATTENNQELGIANAQADANLALTNAAAAQATADLGELAYNWRDSSYTLYVNGNEVLTTTHKVYFPIPNLLEYQNGAEFVGLRGYCFEVSTSGTVTMTLKKYVKATQTWQTDLLTINLTVDANKIYSIDSAVQPVINSVRKNFAIGDAILVEITGAGTGVKHAQAEIILRPIEA